jgi:sporulation integral membrane protein YlbJ
VPSLFPFFIATELLKHTQVVPFCGKLLHKIMRPLFNIPGEGAFALIMGIISGYPVGAKITADFKEQGICTPVECERLLSFTNNSGPLFIVGTCGVSIFYDTKTGILLLITHILACLTVGILFRWWKRNSSSLNYSQKNSYNASPNANINSNNIGEILAKSIMSSIQTVLLIGGFVVLFSVLISILERTHILFGIGKILNPILGLLGISPNYSHGIISGVIELTNGVSLIGNVITKNISASVIIASFLFGFGGISVLLQVLSITSKSRISIKPYIIGKLLQGCLAALYTFLILQNFLLFRLDL